MRFGRYISLLGLASKDKSLDSTAESKNVDRQPIETKHQSLKTASLPPTVLDLVPKATTLQSTNHHEHHNHAHAHLHAKKHHDTHGENQHDQIPLHPTQKAYLAQAKAKQAAIEKKGQQILMEQEKSKRSLDAFHRPLIITNHLEDETVYPAYSSVEQSGGFKLAPGESHTELLPAGTLTMFRSWIRRGCTEGPGENELHCLTGNCNGKLVCEGWGDYGVSLAENACFPSGSPPGCYTDASFVEGFTTLPITFSMDGCNTIMSCDPTSIQCPANMQVKDEHGKLLACSCGHSDWNLLLDPVLGCPNSGGTATQKALKERCPGVYAWAEDDNEGQKYCPYSENNAMIIDIGKKQTQADIVPPPPTQVDPVNQAVIAEKQTTIIPPIQTTTAPPVWGPDSPGWSEWIATYKWDGNK